MIQYQCIFVIRVLNLDKEIYAQENIKNIAEEETRKEKKVRIGNFKVTIDDEVQIWEKDQNLLKRKRWKVKGVLAQKTKHWQPKGLHLKRTKNYTMKMENKK